MNKKFSTLVAGLLLAGGAFSSAYADKISEVAGNDKFYKLEEGAFIDRTTQPYSTTWKTTGARGWYLNLNADGVGIVEQTVSDYWKIVRVDGGFQLVNLDGDVLKVGTQDVFTLFEGSAAPADDFSQLMDGNTYIGYKSNQPYLLADRDGGYACAWDAVETNLKFAKTIDLHDKDVVKLAQNGTFYTVTKAANDALFSFVDKAGKALTTAEGVREFKVIKTQSGTLLQPVESDKYVKYNNDGTFSTVNTLPDATLFGFSAPADAYLTASELKYFEDGSFSLTIKGWDDKDDPTVDLQDNVFTGSLVPEQAVNGDASKVFLKKANDKYIVAKKELADGFNNAALQLTEISGYELAKDIARSTKKYYAVFQFEYTADQDYREVESLNAINVFDYDGTQVGKIGQLNFRNVAYLAVEPDNQPIHLYSVSIKLGGDKIVDWKTFLQQGKYAVIKCVTKDHSYTNKYLGIDKNVNSAFVTSADNDLETQWAVTIPDGEYGVEATDNYVLKNRENPAVTYTLGQVGKLYTTSTANQYRINGLTYLITFVDGKSTDGYTTLDPIALKNQQYYVGVYSPVWKGTAWLSENHKNEHKIGLDSDKDNADLWIITPKIAPRAFDEDIRRDYVKATDSVYVISTIGYYNDAKDVKAYREVKDTLKIATYTLTNVSYRETIQQKLGDYFDCDEESNSIDLRIALRHSGKYLNLVPVDYGHALEGWQPEPADDDKLYQTLGGFYSKIYAGDSADKGLLNSTNLYNQTENDLFVLEAKDAPAYLKLNQGDVIRIYREGNESEQLFENGEFASLGNAAQLKDMNPALYVDTAWMNRNEAVNRYDYMLAVNVDRIVKAYECNVPDHKDLYHYVDTTYGRFLVNLVDSTVVKEDINDIHYSKYEYLKMPKLGFKYGFHTADKFFVPNAKDTTVYTVGNANRNIAKFAFQMVDDKNFVIETSYNNNVKDPSKNITGYLQWINGNLVVTNDFTKAEVFSLTADDRTPTANEAVAAEVSVVAVKGAIIVKGAAGKVVTVANILGQTIANQVAASDNVTIAAPAGIAVVTVDGEATKVVVK